MKNKKCTSEPFKPITCYEYNIYLTDKEKTKEGSESLQSTFVNEKCLFVEENKLCTSQEQYCTNYTGTDPIICRPFVAIRASKECVIKEGKCVEIDSYIYNHCHNYYGKDKNIREAIQTKTRMLYDISLKCIFHYDEDSPYCEEVAKNCSEAKSEIECSKLKPTDTNKICIFKENSCVEQFKICEAYQNSGATIDKETCESIIMESDYRKKCQFIGGRCTQAKRKCSDFNVDSIANLCYNNILPLDTKRCSYSNKTCSLIDKSTCLELFDSKNATKDNCSKAKTSSDYRICSLKSYGSGCDEYSNPVVKPASNSESESGGKKNDGKNLDLFVFILFALQCLFF